MSELEAISNTLIASAKLLTGKDVDCTGKYQMLQTPWTIYVGTGGDRVLLLHEACHHLAANKEMLTKHNLG